MSPSSWIVALVVTFAAALVQGIVGLGFAVVSVPVLSLVDPRLAPVPQLLVTLPLAISMTWRERSHLDLSGVGWVLAGRLPGAGLGLALLVVGSSGTLDVLIGAVVLVAVLIVASGFHLRRNAATEFATGVVSGTTSLVASIGGPPLALLYSDASEGTARSSMAAVFTVGILLTLSVRMAGGFISWEDVRIAAVLFPALVAGFLVSSTVKDRIDRTTFRRAMLTVSALAAAGLLARGLM